MNREQTKYAVGMVLYDADGHYNHCSDMTILLLSHGPSDIYSNREAWLGIGFHGKGEQGGFMGAGCPERSLLRWHEEDLDTFHAIGWFDPHGTKGYESFPDYMRADEMRKVPSEPLMTTQEADRARPECVVRDEILPVITTSGFNVLLPFPCPTHDCPAKKLKY